jgi:CRISPR-associated protein Cas1
MKKMLNTLYITSQSSYLYKDGETIAIKVENELKQRLPIHTIGSIVCFGQVSCSPYLLGHCAENDVSISFLTDYGRFLAKVQGPVSGNVLLRREQYRQADDPLKSAIIASGFLTGKLLNTLQVLKRPLRDHPDKINIQKLEDAINNIKRYVTFLEKETDLDKQRGIEGKASADYFNVFNELITVQKNDFNFQTRNRRPPLDPVNCLLSFIYTLLYHDARSALETVGLDPSVGYLHRDRPGRHGLALDLMEELRSVVADRLCITLINLQKVNIKGFKKTESGAVLMDDDTRKTVLVAYQDRKREEIMHPFLQEKIPVGMILFAQAQLLSRYLRGDLNGYPPFVWR